MYISQEMPNLWRFLADFMSNDNQMNILKCINTTPVQRNSGMDGFLNEFVNDRPVSIKIQKEGETLKEVASKLYKSSKTKKCDFCQSRYRESLRYGSRIRKETTWKVWEADFRNTRVATLFQTGDNGNMLLCFMAMILSCTGTFGTIVFSKRKCEQNKMFSIMRW